ncbi:zinc-dependent peptidase [Flavihumibacter rivuli]|uniref:zinc-dependent peptidase n=1 Tax=Flavihumibacter rivuli TaxID=2838156 RepID=UPI001BDE332E|nr:zinc-dependent peptidase [Flavihumibacter rivuli]ULQ56611.1 zinc-dependent peptidase [Flavihumibacter rivuli]
MTLILAVFGTCFVLVLALWGYERLRYGRAMVLKAEAHQQGDQADYAMENPEWEHYHQWLNEHHAYYRSLSEINKTRFLRRVLHFMHNKEFEYVDLEPIPLMPLLISAAAIQLTFGLEEFRLDQFEKIYVVRTAYRMHGRPQALEGHVNQTGIYLSWEHIYKAYADHSEVGNVGIHEMAHALAYMNHKEGAGVNKVFRDKFKAFSRAAAPVYQKLRHGQSSIFGDYATTDFHEFWAVAAEVFFGKPLQFRAAEPELYQQLCILLNQDPIEVYGLGGKS